MRKFNQFIVGVALGYTLAFTPIFAASSYIGGNNEFVRVTMTMGEQFIARLNQLSGTWATMIGPGNGSSDADYATIATQFGFADNATAHSAVSELNSGLGKLTTDASVTNVNAALVQMFNKFRQFR